MGENIKSVVVFMAGAAIGSVATWFLLKTKYEQLADEEIEEVREYYCDKLEKTKDLICEDYTASPEGYDDEDELDEDENEPQPTRAETRYIDEPERINYSGYYKQIVADLGYDNEDEETPERPKRIVIPAPTDDPYVISPDEFGEKDEYETISLTYYDGDKYLADDMDELVDIEDTVGFDALEHFGEHEDDAVHVRNDARKIDYEILLDLGKYKDVVNNK